MKNIAKIFAIIGVILAIALVVGFIPDLQNEVMADPGDYYSPYDLAYSPNGNYIAVSDVTKGNVAIINASTGVVDRTVALNGKPKGVAWSSSNMLYVAEYDGKNVAEIDPTDGSIDRRFQTARKPFGVAVAGNNLVVTNYGLGTLSVVDLTTGTVQGSADVDNYPMYVDVTTDNTYAVVGHHIPTGNAFDAVHASRISFVNIGTRNVDANIELPNGCTGVYDVECSPDGNWVYVAHTFAKTNIGTVIIDNGWISTNAVSIIDANTMTYYTTFLLDTMAEGASNPWGITVSSDSNTMWVSVAGIHKVYKVDLYNLHELLLGNLPGFSGGSGFDPDEAYVFISKPSGKCIDVPGGDPTNGTQLVQYSIHGGVNQQWKVTDADPGYYYIASVGTSKELDNLGSTSNNAPIVEWDHDGSNDQQWDIVDLGNNYYKVLNRTSGKAIEFNGSLENMAGLVQQPDDGTDDQQWDISMVGGSTSGYDPLYRSKSGFDKPYSDIWLKIAEDTSARDMLKYDLGALWGADLLTRILLPGEGPRGIDIAPGGASIAVGSYFEGEVYEISTSTDAITDTIALGVQPADDTVRSGERLYYDGATTLEQWLSCATCHPEGRTDGVKWDLGNDGLGNYKTTKTHVNTFEYTPKTWRGVRPDATASTQAGYKFIKFRMYKDWEIFDVSNYIRTLEPEVSPYRNLSDDSMTADAIAGQTLFNGTANCSGCHSGEYFTNMGIVDVGTADATDIDGNYCTPTLIELWRTAPYLHDGSAPTMLDVFTEAPGMGNISSLNSTEKDQLAAYLLQIPANGPGPTPTPSPEPTPTPTPTPTPEPTPTPTPAPVNLAAGILPTTSATFTNPANMTNGSTGDYSDSYPNDYLQWVQLDLGAAYNIDDIKLWHYFADGRTYHDVIVLLSNDSNFSSGVTTVFNNDSNNSAGWGVGTDSEYSETSGGKDIAVSAVNARYVRFYSNGSTSNNSNHYCEIEVYGESGPTPTPEPTPTPIPGGWTQLTGDDFEAGFGNFVDGGLDCARDTEHPSNGSYAIEIQDNSGNGSSMWLSSNLNLSSYTELRIDFNYYAKSMESGEDYWLRYSSDGGSSWSTIQTWVSGSTLTQNSVVPESVIIDSGSYTFNTEGNVRFQCDASKNDDEVNIDDVIIMAR
jgi:hypothetical protein